MKKWYQSKTIWTNVIAFTIALLGLFNEQFLNSIGIVDTAKFLALVGTFTTFANIVLRLLFTAEPIGVSTGSALPTAAPNDQQLNNN